MSSSTSRGFTLIELMITIAVLAIGSALAYPSFSGAIQSNRVATATNSVIAAFNVARMEAIRSNRGAGVCPSNAGTGCDGTDWNVGYLAFVDVDGSGAFSAGDRPIRYFEPNRSLQLSATTGQGEAAGGSIENVSLDRSGRVTTAVEIALKTSDCKTGQPYQRRVIVRRTGQARTEKENCQ